MGVSADRNPAACFTGETDQIDAHVLTIRIRVDLDCLVQFRSDREYPRPIGTQSQPEVINASARVSEYLESGITQCRYITVGLIIFLAQGGIKQPRTISSSPSDKTSIST